jgi:adenosylcobinamide-GDP ribazoletransferase
VRVVLWLELFLCSGVMLGLSPVTGGMVLCIAVFCFGYYRRRSYRELGGITGDMAGYFVVICETAMAVAAAVGSRI